jgi:hypothetical protein
MAVGFGARLQWRSNGQSGRKNAPILPNHPLHEKRGAGMPENHGRMGAAMRR